MKIRRFKSFSLPYNFAGQIIELSKCFTENGESTMQFWDCKLVMFAALRWSSSTSPYLGAGCRRAIGFSRRKSSNTSRNASRRRSSTTLSDRRRKESSSAGRGRTGRASTTSTAERRSTSTKRCVGGRSSGKPNRRISYEPARRRNGFRRTSSPTDELKPDENYEFNKPYFKTSAAIWSDRSVIKWRIFKWWSALVWIVVDFSALRICEACLLFCVAFMWKWN